MLECNSFFDLRHSFRLLAHEAEEGIEDGGRVWRATGDVEIGLEHGFESG